MREIEMVFWLVTIAVALIHSIGIVVGWISEYKEKKTSSGNYARTRGCISQKLDSLRAFAAQP